MKKIIGFILLISLIGAGSAFAHSRESGRPNDRRSNDNRTHYHKKQPNHMHSRGGKPQMMGAPLFIEIREITGEIIVRERNFHVIKSEGEEIRIILPLAAIRALNITTGSEISIKGIEVQGRDMDVASRAAAGCRNEARGMRRSENDAKTIRVFELQHDGRKFMVFGNQPNKDKSKNTRR